MARRTGRSGPGAGDPLVDWRPSLSRMVPGQEIRDVATLVHSLLTGWPDRNRAGYLQAAQTIWPTRLTAGRCSGCSQDLCQGRTSGVIVRVGVGVLTN